MGLSYKAAWEAVEAMNNLADRPLVERSVGGRGGGGTRLTDRGRELVATYLQIAAEHERFVDEINARMGDMDRDLRMLGRFTMMTSARNHFVGKVVRVERGAVNDEVELVLSGGERIVSTITHVSVENLGLQVGREAIAKYFMIVVGTGNKVEFVERQVIPLNETTLLVVGFNDFLRNRDGKLVPEPARFTMVVVRRGDEWLIVHHHSSLRPPPTQ